MKWNTQRKSVVAVLALAGAAFCVDRFVLGYGPRSASAIESTADILASAPARSNADAPALIRTLSLPARLDALSAATPGPELPSAADALCIPAAWAPLLLEPQQTPAPGGASLESSSSPDTTEFSVSSVFLGAREATTAARINGSLIFVGKSIRGHTLLRIEKGSPSIVVLSGPSGELRIPFTLGGTNTIPGPDDAPTLPRRE